MGQRNKNRNPSSLVYLISEWYVDAVVDRVLFFCCLKPMARNDIWTRKTSVTITVIFRKYHSESYLITALPFSTIRRHIDNSILKDKNIRAKCFLGKAHENKINKGS